MTKCLYVIVSFFTIKYDRNVRMDLGMTDAELLMRAPRPMDHGPGSNCTMQYSTTQYKTEQ